MSKQNNENFEIELDNHIYQPENSEIIDAIDTATFNRSHARVILIASLLFFIVSLLKFKLHLISKLNIIFILQGSI